LVKLFCCYSTVVVGVHAFIIIVSSSYWIDALNSQQQQDTMRLLVPLGALLVSGSGAGWTVAAFQSVTVPAARLCRHCDPHHQGRALCFVDAHVSHRKRTGSRSSLFSLTTGGDDDDTSTTASAATNQTLPDAKDGKDFELDPLLIQGALGLVALILVYTAGSSLWAAASGVASDAATQLPGALVGLLAAVASALWEGLTILLPALFKAASAGVQAAAPVVQQASQVVGDAASPYVSEATAKMTEAAAPYVDQLSTAVDTQIVAPLTSAVDVNVLAPMKEASGSLSNSVSSTVDATVNSVTSSVDATMKDAGNSIKSALSL
jgi:hypothetical protein